MVEASNNGALVMSRCRSVLGRPDRHDVIDSNFDPCCPGPSRDSQLQRVVARRRRIELLNKITPLSLFSPYIRCIQQLLRERDGIRCFPLLSVYKSSYMSYSAHCPLPHVVLTTVCHSYSRAQRIRE